MMNILKENNSGRPRTRSIRYSIKQKNFPGKYEVQHIDNKQTRSRSIINIEKFGKIIDFNKKRQKEHFTMDITHQKEDLYLQTFTTFMSRAYLNEIKQNTDFEVFLPHYHSQYDQNESQFTLLDQVQKPINYIENEIKASTKQLKRQNYDIQMLKSQLKTVKNTIQSKLEEIQKETQIILSQLKHNFHKNEVIQHERKLRNRKQIILLQKGHELDKKSLQTLKQRNLQIQQIIFDCHPFQLQFPQNKKEQAQEDQYM